DERARAVERIADVRTLRAHQFPEDQGPLAHPVRPRRYREINNFYTATVYEKGSEVVGMIRTILGPEDFRRGMDLYFERHDGDAATIEDFLKVFEDVSGRDLAQFALWYHQAGTPSLTIASSYDQASRTLTLDVEQSVPPTPGESRKRLMHIPLAFGLVGADGRDMAFGDVDGVTVEGAVMHLRKRRHVAVFHDVAERPALSLNRGFSAPVTVNFEQSSDERMFLARHDGDLFARWQALTTLLTETLKAAAASARGGKTPRFPPAVITLCGETASNGTLEPAFRALALTLPAESDISREIGSNIDPDAILSARNALTGAIAAANGPAFAALYASLGETGSYSPDAASAGRRALRNVMLDYVTVWVGAPDHAAAQYAAASNMTDRAAALAVLVQRHAGAPETAAALADFETRFRRDPLVLDKWFQVQAMAPGAGSVEAVRALMRHPAFALANPNRVRALIGTFSTANQTGFHRADGAGYDLLAEIVLAVEPNNAQLAARLATALRSWRSLEPVRQAAARRTLLRIKGAPGLSTDVRDIVERTLG
ncbi:MAG: DUF3458 domain-containing protein, partial [Mesorhizobium sp.]|nr:DUF3458 domain-containing protein [Mesorhizobium sp.]